MFRPPGALLGVERRVRGPAGPAAPPSAGWQHPPLGDGDGRGTCPALPGLYSVGPLLPVWGRRGDVSLPRARPSCASYHPSWDKQESSNEASSPDSLCASITRPCELSQG